MLSESQIIEKKDRIKTVVDNFLSYDQISINELAQLIKVPSSTIQRDLNNIEYITLIYGTQSKEILLRISNKLKENKNFGVIKGGTNSTKNNENKLRRNISKRIKTIKQ